LRSGEYGGKNAIWTSPSVGSRYSRTSLLRKRPNRDVY
jgi:hypothetical protein